MKKSVAVAALALSFTFSTSLYAQQVGSDVLRSKPVAPALDDATPLPEPIGPLIEFIFWLRNTRNDLFAPAAEEAPLVETAVRALASDRDCAFARMSGSGATAFGIFMSQEAANRAAARIQKAEPDWWVAVTRTGGS